MFILFNGIQIIRCQLHIPDSFIGSFSSAHFSAIISKIYTNFDKKPNSCLKDSSLLENKGGVCI